MFERELREQAIYGEARVRVASRDRGAGMEFHNALQPTIPPLPDILVTAAMQGLRDAASSGPDGYPLEDVEVTCSILRCATAATAKSAPGLAAEAFRKAVAGASPARLEPIMAVETTVDEYILGAMIGDLNQRRGQVQNIGERGTKKLVSSLVPLRSVAIPRNCASLSEGRATFSMLFHSYDSLQG